MHVQSSIRLFRQSDARISCAIVHRVHSRTSWSIICPGTTNPPLITRGFLQRRERFKPLRWRRFARIIVAEKKGLHGL